QNNIGLTNAGNQLDGVLILDAPGVLIGGVSNAHNTIQGNTRIGVEIKNSAAGLASNTQIINNLIDSNVREGILATAVTGTVIGGFSSGQGNTISNNGFSGIMLEVGANNSTIQGNTIGVNTREGIIVDASSNVLIGGPQPLARNIITG